MFIIEEAHSAADVSAWRRRDAGPAAAGVDGAGADAAAPDGRGAGATLRRHLASAWRGARLLESRCRKARTSSSRSSRSRWSRSATASSSITGLDMPEAMATDEEPGGDHARGAVLLSGARPRRNAVSPFLGVTIDQMIAQKYGQDTILSSIQLGVEDTGNFGNCNWGYSCAYTNSISWTSPTQPLPTRSESARGLRAPVRRRQRARRSGWLDGSRTPASWIRSRSELGALQERPRLRATERGSTPISKTFASSSGASGSRWSNSVKEPTDDVPFGLPESKHVHFRLMYDLMALAFEGDITRSATFMLGRDLTGTSFPESGFNGGWHGSSHHGDKPENVANYAKINRYHVQNLAYFCEKLQNIPDGDGTLLDHVLIYKGSNMGNSHRHAHEKVPVILVGGIDGTFKGNRHIVFPDNTQRTSNMLLSILHRSASSRTGSGRSTGPLPAIEPLPIA